MIFIIHIYSKKIHYLEFVNPIEDALKKNKIEFESIHYKMLTEELVLKAEKIIISGTSLRDNEFLEDINKFNWIKEFEKPILGICGGMHILGLVYHGKLKKQQEIGLTNITFKDKFLGVIGEKQVFELHNYYVKSNSFDVIGLSENCLQAVKHKQKPFYGVLFHPEVRNKDLLINFANL